MRRGVDSNGDVANFVETEQILLYNNLHPNPDNNENKLNYSKFKIIRGSIPLFFTQDSSKLQPTPIVKKDYKTNKSYLIKHFNNLEKFYNKELELSIDKNITNNEYKQFTVVNLINKSKKEQKLGEMFSSILNELSINNCWFDFHAICKGLNFDNINLLLDETINNDDNNKTTTTVNENLLNYSYSSNYLDLKQKGIFRINCIDCLDRTNIISKFLSSKILERQLKDLNILNIRQQHQQDNNKSNNDIISIMNTKKFNFKYSNLWADNGDSISNQYASTNALKGDFTRTSKRKYSGILNDGYLTLIRYFNNYIRDYYNQILIDFLIGNAKFEIFEIFESNFNNFDPNLKIEADLNKKIIFNLILKSCINNNNTHSTTDNFRKKLNNNLNIDKKEVIIDAFWCKSCFEINTLINYKKPLKDIILILTNENLRLISYDLNEKTEDIEKIVRDDTDIEGEMEPDTEIEDNNNSNNNNNNNGSGEIYDTGSETIKRIEIYKIKNTDLIKFNHGCYYFNIDSNLSKNKDKNIGLKFQFNKCTLEIMNLKDGSETDDILISPSLKQIQDERYKNEENVHLLSDDFQQHSDQKLPILNISDDDDKEESIEENGDGLEDVNDLKFLAVKFPQDASPSAKQRAISLISKFCYTAETAENDIVSLEKARRHTPLINTLSYQVKKFIWS
ncbi:hypothetical protein B5S31_g5510 [[Candida] boidinii]|nr:hypothetical protein B5S31_g5510 [[Candida] boidinii]